MLVEFYKSHRNAKTPVRANPSDAGLDVFACFDDKDVIKTINPGESVLVNTGLKFGIPHGYMLQVMNRSSVASKRSLIVGAHVVDSGYDGQIFINLHNIGNQTEFISHGEKIAQLVMLPVIHFRAIESLDDDLYDSPLTISNRGDGALGSTDG